MGLGKKQLTNVCHIFSQVAKAEPDESKDGIDEDPELASSDHEFGLSPIPGPPSPMAWSPQPPPSPDRESTRDMFSDEEESLGT